MKRKEMVYGVVYAVVFLLVVWVLSLFHLYHNFFVFIFAAVMALFALGGDSADEGMRVFSISRRRDTPNMMQENAARMAREGSTFSNHSVSGLSIFMVAVPVVWLIINYVFHIL